MKQLLLLTALCAAFTVSAPIEEEVAQLDPADQPEFLASLGLDEPASAKVIRAVYDSMGLITFFTVGPKEARAWTVRTGATAPEAAGVIHSDFQRGFIRAETIDFDSFVTLGGEQGCRDAGRQRHSSLPRRLSSCAKYTPSLNGTTADTGVRHRMWVVSDDAMIAALTVPPRSCRDRQTRAGPAAHRISTRPRRPR